MDGGVAGLFPSTVPLRGMLHVFSRQPTQQNVLLSESE